MTARPAGMVSLVSVIAVTELLKASQDISSVIYQVIPLLIVASIWYLVMTTILSAGQHYIERYYGRGSTAATPPAFLPRLPRSLATRRARPGITGQHGQHP